MSLLLLEIPQPVACIAFRGVSRNYIIKKFPLKLQNFNRHPLSAWYGKKSNYVMSRFIFTSEIYKQRARVQAVPLRSKKKSKGSEDRPGSKFVDCITVKVKAGNGGDGMVSLLSLYRVEKAGPDGGKWNHQQRGKNW